MGARQLGTIRELPWHSEGPEAAGVDLAAVEVAGSEEESMERVA